MSDMTYARKVMASLLLEAELKEVLPNMEAESIIRLVLANGEEKTFIVDSNLAGRVIMHDKSNNKPYTFTKDAVDDGVLTVYEYDKTKTSGEGKKIVLKVKEFFSAKGKGGSLEQVDLVKPVEESRLEEAKNEMNQTLKNAKKGSIIQISTEEKTSETDGIINNIWLRVNDISPKKMSCTLEDVKSDGETSSKIKGFVRTFKNRNIYLSVDDLVKIENDDLVLKLYRSDVGFLIRGLLGIEVNGGDGGDDSEEYTPMTKKELMDKVKNSPYSKEYLEAMDKTKDFWETLTNATPKGVNQLNKMLDDAITKNSYLTVGRQVKFELLSDNIFIDDNSNAKLLSSNNVRRKQYSGKVEKGMVIKSGTRRDSKGHWELKILKDLGDSKYKVRVTYCDSNLECAVQDNEGRIKIIE